MEKRNIVIIGSSGASLPILMSIFKDMPKLRGPVVLVQHMPYYINEAVRDNLANETTMTVKIAESDEPLKSGTLYIAPSEMHIKLVHNARIRLESGSKVNYVCPSIDVAMLSVEKDAGSRPMGILLAGVGDDGVKGICHIKRVGGVTVALDTSASTISGMAEDAIATGAVDFILGPEAIREKVVSHLSKLQ
jgi:two-component system, chemotaxis family, protein-glutamate methylesterase/glutaminase